MNEGDILIPDILRDVPGIVAGFTTRHGGVSAGAYQSMNLGLSTDDDPSAVRQNRILLARWAGADVSRLAIAGQIHGEKVKVVDSPGLFPGFDSLVTSSSNIMLCITAADCAVILLANAEAGVIAACHAGWRGTVARVVSETIEAMRDLRARPEATRAYVSPCISTENFEVGEEVAAHFDERYIRRSSQWEKPHVDLKSVLADQLFDAGIPEVEVSDRCTFSETPDFFSHRAESGVTGRMMGFILRR